MDLKTEYMGLKLRTPIVPSASPLSRDIDDIKKMEDAGASAVVLYSLFEEELEMEQKELAYHLEHGSESFAESLSYFPEPMDLSVGPEEYLRHVQNAKQAVSIPIIASLNGCSMGGWTSYAKKMEEAGADAIELNIYYIPADGEQTGADVEENYLDIVRAVKSIVNIPVAVKLSPFFSSFSNMAKRLDEAGADALALFNRFYQPDLSLEELEVKPNVLLSTPMAMRLPMRWIAILYKKIKASMAATSGIHTPEDVVKMLMVGADVTMVCSALLRHGPGRIHLLEEGLKRWMSDHDYSSVQQLKGSMSQVNVENPAAFERAQYMRTIKSWRPEMQLG